MQLKKYSHYIGNLLFWAANFFTLALCMPAIIKNIEAQNPLLGAGDFISESMRYPGGILFVVNTALQQFFVSPWIGAAIAATLASICACSISAALRTKQMQGTSVIGSILAAAILFFEFPDILQLLQTTLALVIYCLYAYARTRINSAWNWLPVIVLLAYPVLGTAITFSLYTTMLFHDLIISRNPRIWGFSALGMVLTIIVSYLWSDYMFYLNEQQRQLIASNTCHSLIMLAVPFIPLLSGTVKKIAAKIHFACVEWGIRLLAVLMVPLLYLTQKSKIIPQENYYAMEQAAESADWQKVYHLANADAPSYTDLQLRYALLAENEAGTLADHLFSYPVASTTDLYFWRKTEEQASFFNGLFYKSINVADEYMHQIFEMGTQNHSTTSARTIRHLTEAALMQGDMKLAQKYFKIARKSQKDQAWTEKIEKQLHHGGMQNAKSIPDRSDFLIGSYEPKTEFIYTTLNDSSNIKRINLMLCSFLLEKDMKRFQQALSVYPKLFQKHLPEAYAEAYLMAKAENPKYSLPFQIPQSKVQDWMRFLQLLNEERINELSQYYSNSYWYYYLFTDVKPLKE